MKILYLKRHMIFIASSVLLQGCERKIIEPTYPKDSWYSVPASNAQPWDWKKLNSSDIHKVTDSAKLKAERMLSQKSIVQLAPTQIRTLVGRQFTDSRSKTPYLIRAVYFNKETGRFEVYYKGKTLWVEHGSLGHSTVSMKRQPLIVLLKARPTQVFVTCSMDE